MTDEIYILKLCHCKQSLEACNESENICKHCKITHILKTVMRSNLSEILKLINNTFWINEISRQSSKGIGTWVIWQTWQGFLAGDWLLGSSPSILNQSRPEPWNLRGAGRGGSVERQAYDTERQRRCETQYTILIFTDWWRSSVLHRWRINPQCMCPLRTKRRVRLPQWFQSSPLAALCCFLA